VQEDGSVVLSHAAVELVQEILATGEVPSAPQ